MAWGARNLISTRLDQWSEPSEFSRVPEWSRGKAREGSGVARHKLASVQQRRLRYFVVQCGRCRVRRRLRGPRVAELRAILPEPRRGRGTDPTVDVGPKCGIDGRVRAQQRCREHRACLLCSPIHAKHPWQFGHSWYEDRVLGYECDRQRLALLNAKRQNRS